ILAKGDPDALAQVLSSKVSEKELNEALGEWMTPETVKAALESNEILEILHNRLTDDRKASLLTNSLSPKELGEVLTENLSDAEKANLLATSDLNEAGKILSKALKHEEVNRLIKEALPDEMKAKALASELSKAEISELVSENLEIGEKARILAHYDPEKSVELIKSSVSEPELA